MQYNELSVDFIFDKCRNSVLNKQKMVEVRSIGTENVILTLDVIMICSTYRQTYCVHIENV